MKEVFTSFEGRIGRQTLWLSWLLLIIAAAIISSIIVMLFGTRLPTEPMMHGYNFYYDLGLVGGILMTIASIFYIWAGLAIAIKRWHDRNKSGWWVLIGLVPVIGGLWVLIENGFLKGTDGPNDYGPDPLRK